MADENIPAIKPGYKSTEFWITVALGIAGVVLLATGKDTLGTALLAAAGVSYSGARGLAKFK